ncbi:MAG: hypothetical protein QM599_11680 [Pseudoxanthomonas sp.]
MNDLSHEIQQKIQQEQIEAQALDAITAPYVKSGWKWLLIALPCVVVPVLGIFVAIFAWGNGLLQAIRTLGKKNTTKGGLLFIGTQILGLGAIAASLLITILAFSLLGLSTMDLNR